MVLPGYRVDLGNATALAGTTAAAVPRAIGLIDRSGQYTLALADSSASAYDSDHFRGAVTDGAGNFWGAGSAHFTYYFGTNAPTATIQTDYVNTRSINIFNGDLYALASAGANGLIKFSGLPTDFVGTVANYLPGFSSTTTTDFSVSPSGLLIYITVGSSVQKWQSDGTTFTQQYTFSLGVGSRYITVDYSGASPVIYVTTADGRIMTIVDTGSGATPTTLLASGPNQLFKGLRFGPTVARPTLYFTRDGSKFILTWSGSFVLQSATNVGGPYQDVGGQTNPQTNNVGAPPDKQFFRLRQ
jgi:hypothetical protein